MVAMITVVCVALADPSAQPSRILNIAHVIEAKHGSDVYPGMSHPERSRAESRCVIGRLGTVLPDCVGTRTDWDCRPFLLGKERDKRKFVSKSNRTDTSAKPHAAISVRKKCRCLQRVQDLHRN